MTLRADPPMQADEVSFRRFATEEHPRLVGALSLYCGDAGIAEELAGDALVRARERWHHVSRMQRPGAWAHRVALNLAKSHFRRRAAERRAYQRHGPSPDTCHDPDLAQHLALRQATARLPGKIRAVIVLRYFLDWSIDDTADATGLTPRSVITYTNRGVGLLRSHLEQTSTSRTQGARREH